MHKYALQYYLKFIMKINYSLKYATTKKSKYLYIAYKLLFLSLYLKHMVNMIRIPKFCKKLVILKPYLVQCFQHLFNNTCIEFAIDIKTPSKSA